jgi:homoserine dehydrogenase
VAALLAQVVSDSRPSSALIATLPSGAARVGIEPPAAPRTIRVGFLGLGRVGQAVSALVARARPDAIAAGVDLQCVAALVRDALKPRDGAIVPVTTDPDELFRRDLDVIVEVLGGVEPARTLVTRAIELGVAVVTANKSLIAAHGPELRALASRRGVPFAFDATVLAGVPFVGSLSRRPLVAGIQRICGILNGTSHFVVCAIARGASFDEALAEAQRRGYAEPDSRADVSGRDGAEKLSILLQLAGVRAAADTIPSAGIDTVTPNDLAAARAFGGTIKPMVLADLRAPGAGAWVGPAFVEDRHPCARLEGVANALELTRADGHAVSFAGPGAGPDVTALTIIDDIVESTAVSPARRDASYVRHAADVVMTRPPETGWFLRVRGAATWRGATIEQRLDARHVSVLRVFARGEEWFVRIAPAPWAQVQYAMTALRARGAEVTLIPVIS